MISLSGVILVRLPLNVDGKTRNVMMMEELNKRTKRTGATGATTMTDSFLSTKMKQLKNIQATVESTTGETQEMWINKWYELIRSIAKKDRKQFLEVHLGTSLSGLSNFERGSRLRDRGQKTNKINVFRVLSRFFPIVANFINVKIFFENSRRPLKALKVFFLTKR
jgi:hypothetical protein